MLSLLQTGAGAIALDFSGSDMMRVCAVEGETVRLGDVGYRDIDGIQFHHHQYQNSAYRRGQTVPSNTQDITLVYPAKYKPRPASSSSLGGKSGIGIFVG